MAETIQVEEYANVGGNYFDKHNSKNVIMQRLMKNFYQTFIDVLEKEQFSTLIDIGCGEGHLTNILQERFGKKCTIDAFEYDEGTIKKVNALYPKINVRQGDIRTLKTKKKYDVLIASEVLEHIPDVDEAIKNCKSLAKTCVFSVPNTPLFCLANMSRLKYLSRLGKSPGHVHTWSAKKFQKDLARYFSEVKVVRTGVWTVAVCK